VREFASTKYRLNDAPIWQKWLYTIFLGFMLIGLLTNFLFGMTKTGLTSGAIVAYYRGDPDRLMFGKTFQELLEVAHAHAFMMPLVLLVLGHLFFLTEWSAQGKRFVLTVALVTIFLDITTPWAVRYLHPAWAHVKLVAGYGLGASFLCLIGVSLWAMWIQGE